MFYPYEKRMNELERISNLPYDGVKKKSLEHFIEQERGILNKLAPPRHRSQALDSAIQKLNIINMPQETKAYITKQLF